MIRLNITDGENSIEPPEFNFGPNDRSKARGITQALRIALAESMIQVDDPEGRCGPDGDDFVITVRCARGTIAIVQRLVGIHVGAWARRARGEL